MKFGGTSVGRPERMHQVSQLITADTEPKIVVLSALSGTTNALVQISEALSQSNRAEAKRQIDKLYDHYQSFIKELTTSEQFFEEARAILSEHF